MCVCVFVVWLCVFVPLSSQLIKSIRKDKQAGPFNVSVDPVALNIPDYPTIILHPIDLGTIEDRMEKEQYTDPEQVISDCRLVFRNAFVCNTFEKSKQKKRTKQNRTKRRLPLLSPLFRIITSFLATVITSLLSSLCFYSHAYFLFSLRFGDLIIDLFSSRQQA